MNAKSAPEKGGADDFVARKPAPTLTIDQALRLATQHQAAGRLRQAEVLLRQVLKQQPKNGHALHLLGVVAHAAGKTDTAIQLIEQAIAAQPNVALFHSNLGEMYRLRKHYDKALTHGERAVALDPHSATALSNLGVAYYDKKDYDKAEDCQRRALAINPTLASALNNLGSIHRTRKDKTGAIGLYRQVLAHHPQHAESINNLGALLIETEQPEEAVQVLLSVIRQQPKYAEAHCNIGNAFLALEQYDKAQTAYHRALTLKPDYPEPYQGLARISQEHKRLDEAQRLALKALNLAPDKPEVHSLLGNLHSEAGYPENAAACYAKALELDPDLVVAHLGKGHLLMEQGDMAGAEASFRRGLALDPDNLGARLSLCQVGKVTADDENFQVLEREAAKLDTMRETRALHLHFALGKCYDDTRQYDKAFPHFLEGCRLKRKRVSYDADNIDKAADNIIRIFSAERIDTLRGAGGAGSDSAVPIFILGMPRSGTTLTEQIIASHPDVYGAGELHDLLQIANQPGEKDKLGYPLCFENITQAELTRLGAQYVTGVRARNAEARHITDKMPANFNCVGLIHLMLPNAKIVHVKRNPVDTCLSCFTKLFNKSQYQSYDLSEIGRYYRNYARIMEHWRSVLPAGSFYEIQYEDLVNDNEVQARALIDYCGLDWHDACLDFHKTERSIRTASVTQVRQPIYTSSVARWRKYEAHLGPLLDVLGDLVPDRA